MRILNWFGRTVAGGIVEGFAFLIVVSAGLAVWSWLKGATFEQAALLGLFAIVLLAFALYLVSLAVAKFRNDSLLADKEKISVALNDPHGECNKTIQELRDGLARELQRSQDKHNLLVAKKSDYDQTLKKLGECESQIKHWKGEAEREKQFRAEQVGIRDQLITEKGARTSELEQQLRVSQDTVEGLRQLFSAPNGPFKLKRVRYLALEAHGQPDKDLTEFFEDKFVENGKLVIPPGLYRKLFGPLNDPALGVRKLLEIEFVHAGTRMSVRLPENISLTLPFPYSVTSENMT